MPQFIALAGNLGDGFKFFGPFNDAASAIQYAERNLDEWSVVALTPPPTDEIGD